MMSKDLRPPGEGRPPAKPMLATLTGEAFDDPEWGYEPKWDGIRAIAICDEETRLITRNDKDVTVAYPGAAPIARADGGPGGDARW